MTSSAPLRAPKQMLVSTNTHRRRRLHAVLLASALLLLLLFAPLWISLVFPRSFLLISSLSSPAHRRRPNPLPYDYDSEPLLPLPPRNSTPLSLRHIVFGIASSSHLWPRRREYIRLWWRDSDMHGHVWMDESVPPPGSAAPPPNPSSLPPLRVSSDISTFRYTNPTGHPSGLRIARIVAESFRLGHRDVRWFVLCDDDTIISPDNLVAVLANYDWREMMYVGGSSENHAANTYFSHSMAFGGGGIAISYPLARELAEMQDECLERYPTLYGSDDRLHACISELGVPLTHHRGFHQWDIRGSAHGLLAAHPITPFVSIHHVEAVEALYPQLNSLESLQLFTKAMSIEPRSFLQRSICYDMKRKLTFSVSLGYVVQVFPSIVLPRDLERSEKTYVGWNWKDNRDAFDLDIRDAYNSICDRPILFFLRDIRRKGNVTIGSYLRIKRRDEFKRKLFCFPRPIPLVGVEEIQVIADSLDENWSLVPRRLCCRTNETNSKHLVFVRQCGKRI